jgi:hypothetical protein
MLGRYNGKSPFLIGKSTINGSFSMGYHLVMTFTVCHGKSPPCY